jgi:hypothetical protein
MGNTVQFRCRNATWRAHVSGGKQRAKSTPELLVANDCYLESRSQHSIVHRYDA